jgi:hypothetical protein
MGTTTTFVDVGQIGNPLSDETFSVSSASNVVINTGGTVVTWQNGSNTQTQTVYLTRVGNLVQISGNGEVVFSTTTNGPITMSNPTTLPSTFIPTSIQYVRIPVRGNNTYMMGTLNISPSGAVEIYPNPGPPQYNFPSGHPCGFVLNGSYNI